MPSKFDQWEKSAGNLDRHMDWEDKTKRYNVDPSGKVVEASDGYGAGFDWKDIQSRLIPLEEQLRRPNCRNLASLRSESASGRRLADRRKMNFAQGAGVTDEQWEDVFGPGEPEPPVEEEIEEPPAEEPKKRRQWAREPVTEETQCAATKKNGLRCTCRKVPGTQYCMSHGREHIRKSAAEVVESGVGV